jgi:hypothetical protein
MGNLLAKLQKNSGPDVFIDLEATEHEMKGDEEKKVFDLMTELLNRTDVVFAAIENYTGCQDLARKAMSEPNTENEKMAFEGLKGAVEAISIFFYFCKDLEEAFPKLLNAIARHSANAEEIPMALCVLLAKLLDFSLRFDQVRMLRPNLSNDFSYYRRLLPKFNKHPDIKVKDDEASGMALFTAQHIPMLNCLVKGTEAAAKMDSNVTMVLALLANSCMKMIRNDRYTSPETNLLCARSMTCCIVLFDHTDPTTAFSKKTPIQLKQCILLLKKKFPNEVSLINAIHFSTQNFANAPQAIQDLCEN